MKASELKNKGVKITIGKSAWYKISQSMDKAGENMKAVGDKT